MPGGEQYVAGRGFEDALAHHDDEAERGGPLREAIVGATEQFQAHDGGQAVRDAGETAQAVSRHKRRRRERCDQTTSCGAAEQRKSGGKSPLLELDVGEEERGGIECEVVGRNVDERVSEQPPPFSGGDGNLVVNEARRELPTEQRKIQGDEDRSENRELTAPELVTQRIVERGKFRTHRGRDDALFRR